ncbi:hypothetical protein [Actinocrispum wychmicini]|uniref:hypothetical protein n=1 Tax=Actinocrispum wychmicini TaxID=1213861 RepID=UPI0010514371|nr:hypothetical protein [Actinocrispum wychmicini]
MTTVIPPVTLVVALLVYFAQVRRIAQCSALGFDASLLQEPSIPAYLARSVGALYVPLVLITGIALVLLWLDRRLRTRLGDPRRLRSVLRISMMVPFGALGLVAIGGVLALLGPLPRAYVELFAPFLLAVVILSVWYGNALRRAVWRKLPTSRRRALDEPGLVTTLLTGFLVALLLFAGVDGFAKVVGRGLARQVIEYPEQNTKPVLLYSKEDLQLDQADASKTTLPGGADGYHHRYEGLRLAFVDGGSYFLIPRVWASTHGKLIVLRQDGLRVEFLR